MTRKITKSNQSEQRSDRGAKRSDRGGAYSGAPALHPSHFNQYSSAQLQLNAMVPCSLSICQSLNGYEPFQPVT